MGNLICLNGEICPRPHYRDDYLEKMRETHSVCDEGWECFYDALCHTNELYDVAWKRIAAKTNCDANDTGFIDKNIGKAFTNLRPKIVDFVYYVDLPEHIKLITMDTVCRHPNHHEQWSIRTKALQILLSKVNNVNLERKGTVLKVVSFWIRTLDIDCIRMLDMFLLNIIAEYKEGILFASTTLKICIGRYSAIYPPNWFFRRYISFRQGDFP